MLLTSARPSQSIASAMVAVKRFSNTDKSIVCTRVKETDTWKWQASGHSSLRQDIVNRKEIVSNTTNCILYKNYCSYNVPRHGKNIGVVPHTWGHVANPFRRLQGTLSVVSDECTCFSCLDRCVFDLVEEWRSHCFPRSAFSINRCGLICAFIDDRR